MGKIDFKKTLKAFYSAPSGRFVAVDVPALQYVLVDGSGDPNTAEAYRNAVAALYAVSYAMKFAIKAKGAADYTVPPLEGLWHADDPAAFKARRKGEWKWTMVIMAPDFVDDSTFTEACQKAKGKLDVLPASLRLERIEEGRCLQALHVGSYDDEGPLLARLHDEIMLSEGLTFNGPHHEIYLSDPRRVEPANLRTILRQPVRPI